MHCDLIWSDYFVSPWKSGDVLIDFPFVRKLGLMTVGRLNSSKPIFNISKESISSTIEHITLDLSGIEDRLEELLSCENLKVIRFYDGDRHLLSSRYSSGSVVMHYYMRNKAWNVIFWYSIYNNLLFVFYDLILIVFWIINSNVHLKFRLYDYIFNHWKKMQNVIKMNICSYKNDIVTTC